ncbi:MAG TPA: helix-turn-helix domain-containing protein [Solirubrobacteraceae bacterium]|jgi:AcrR family transcriptional regulator|nr:helix-turn-helix domain-containing protein [Solirubrobacteraceae bacterium]
MAPSSPPTRTLSTADERRETVLEAAERVFSARGLHGTPTIEIAKAAGISQAYLFRLFPTKDELFMALVRRCNDRVYRTFAEAAAAARASGEEDVMRAIGRSYLGLLADRELLLIQLHAHAACDDDAIREEMRRGFERLVELVERESGGGPEQVRAFFAHGMLLNVLAAMRAEESDAHWARLLLGPPRIDP